MTGGVVLAGWLLVSGPIVGMFPVGNPALVSEWSMPHDRFIATVGAHRSAWAWLNAGFALATIATTAGLVVFALSLPDGSAVAGVLSASIGYLVGGTLWCAVLAIRTRITPHLADQEAEASARPDALLLDAATTGLFQGFVLITGVALAGLGVALLLTATGAVGVAVLILLCGIGAIGWLLGTGDVIPAALYLPTLVLGVALLAHWTP
ncbi:MAG: hypothetical protein R2737_07480 [Candidatus Nanopelagicales bacterium]